MEIQNVAAVYEYPLQIGLLMLVGFVGMKLGFLREESLDALSSYAVKIAMPCMLIYKVPNVSGREDLLATIPVILIAVFLYALTFAVGHLSGRACGYSGDRLNAHTLEVGIGNMAIIGFQLLLAMLGDEVGIYFAAFFLVDQVFLYAVAFPMTYPHTQTRTTSVSFLKRLASPGMIALLVAVGMVFAGIRLPDGGVITKTVVSISNSCQAVSLVFVGATLAQLKLKKGVGLPGCFVVVVLRMLVMPVVVFVLLSFFPVPLLVRQTAALVTALPPAITTSVMEKVNGSDYNYGSLCTSIATALFVITLPVVILILRQLA